MEITEVRIKLMEEAGERLQAFCSITFDDSFVIRDLKIIEGTNGPFVAMPSRKLTAHCPQCGMKNHLRAGFCNQCGGRLKDDRPTKDEDGRAKLYADIAHPINSACREMIQHRVIAEFHTELERAKLPGYVSRYDDFDVDDAFGAKPDAAHASAPRPHIAASTPSSRQHGHGSGNSHSRSANGPAASASHPSASHPSASHPSSGQPSSSPPAPHIAASRPTTSAPTARANKPAMAPKSPPAPTPAPDKDFGAGIF